MGDFNADCSYVTKSKSSKLKLRSAKYHWWIGDDVDTTVAATDCAYDRLRYISVSLGNATHQVAALYSNVFPVAKWQQITDMVTRWQYSTMLFE